MSTHQSFASYCERSAELIQLSGSTLTGESVAAVIEAICRALKAGKPVLVCGNGGSAADSMHLAAELMGRRGSSYSNY